MNIEILLAIVGKAIILGVFITISRLLLYKTWYGYSFNSSMLSSDNKFFSKVRSSIDVVCVVLFSQLNFHFAFVTAVIIAGNIVLMVIERFLIKKVS